MTRIVRPRVLVSRTDRLGDVALTLPLCGLLQAHAGATVVFLGRRYTRPLLEASGAVDEILEWDDAMGVAAGRALVRRARADVVLHVLPRPAVAWAALAAGVPRRVGTSRRWYHWLTCTTLESLPRRASALHESELNVRLARALLPAADLQLTSRELAPHARLTPRVSVPDAVRPLLAPDRFALVLHPKSLGSAREWPLASWRVLIDLLPAERFRVLVTGSAAEGAAMRPWLDALPAHAHDLTGRLALDALIAVLAAAGGVVAASTGPLHIAALLGTPTLGLFARVRPVHAARWGPIGERAEVVEVPAAPPNAAPPNAAPPNAAPPNGAAGAAADLAAIAPAEVLARVDSWARRAA